LKLEKFRKVEISSQKELRAWLKKNHKQEESVWLVTFKKIVLDKYVSRDEVLDELIAFGWVDGVRQGVDEIRTMQLISPRKTKAWAKSYKDRADRLIRENKMHSSGISTVEEAKASGAWNEMNDVDSMLIPNDLRLSLKNHGHALKYFEAFPPSTRRNILRWINSAKTAETRKKRIAATAQEAEHNRRIASHG
jgi:uncharacterized protein YdeI (YjbR/CyaY-like superfamily)